MVLWQDLRFGARQLRTDISFSTIVIVVLALGIGANTTVFTLVNAVLFRGLPVPQPGRLVILSCNNLAQGWTRMGVSYGDFADWRSEAKSFESLAAWGAGSVNLSDGMAAPERYSGARLTANAFSALGAKPVLGRDFSTADDLPGAAPVAILGNAT